MDEMALAHARPDFSSEGAPRSIYRREHKTGFDLYMRKGIEQGLHELESKALSVGVSPWRAGVLSAAPPYFRWAEARPDCWERPGRKPFCR